MVIQAVLRATLGQRHGNHLFKFWTRCSTSTHQYYSDQASTKMLNNLECLKVTRPADFVVHVELNRPDKRNALNGKMWREIGACFDTLAVDENCRSIILSGAGRLFCAGIDLKDFMQVGQTAMSGDLDTARKAVKVREKIETYQRCFTSIEKCLKPVICAIHGGCFGGAVSLVSCTDIRYASQDAYFVLKEIDLGLAADVGALQRLPKIMGNESFVRELAFSARQFAADEALSMGLISRVFLTREELLDGALQMAKLIASKSPVAVQGTKANLNYSRDHSIAESLEYMVTWNMAMLQTEDTVKSAMAAMSKDSQAPEYSKL